MTLIVDEVMLREPNLLVPGKKPVGPVKFNPDFPYKVDAMVLYESSPKVIAGSNISANYVNLSANSINGFYNNIGADMGGSSYGYSNQDLSTVMNSHGNTGTIIVHYYVKDTLPLNTPIFWGTRLTFYKLASGNANNRIGGVFWSEITTSAFDIGHHILVLSWGGPLNKERYLYVDGKFENSTDNDGVTGADYASIDIPRYDGGNSTKRHYYSFSYFRETLPGNLCLSLSLDPYQILIPA